MHTSKFLVAALVITLHLHAFERARANVPNTVHANLKHVRLVLQRLERNKTETPELAIQELSDERDPKGEISLEILKAISDNKKLKRYKTWLLSSLYRLGKQSFVLTLNAEQSKVWLNALA